MDASTVAGAFDMWAFVWVSIPTMLLLGIRHAFDADHITAIDNIVRMHSASKKSRWVGAGFGTGHMISMLGEMIFLILIVGSVTGAGEISFWGGIIGASALALIGGTNLYAMKKWGRTGQAILASRMLTRTGSYNSFISSLLTGVVFGLGFDTATQISALSISAAASAALGVQTAFILASFFSIGMIPLDTLDSVLLRSFFSKMSGSRGFRYMSFALSGFGMTVAILTAYQIFTGAMVVPELTGPLIAALIVVTSFTWVYFFRRKSDGRVFMQPDEK